MQKIFTLISALTKLLGFPQSSMSSLFSHAFLVINKDSIWIDSFAIFFQSPSNLGYDQNRVDTNFSQTKRMVIAGNR